MAANVLTTSVTGSRQLTTVDGQTLDVNMEPGGGGVVPPLYSVVLRPGDTSGADNVFPAWAALMAACENIQGGVRVFFDDSLGAIHIPAGTWPTMHGWVWCATENFTSQSGGAVVTVDDGAHLSWDTLLMIGPMDVTYNGTTDCFAATTEANLLVQAGVFLTCTAAGRFLTASGASGFGFVIAYPNNSFGDGTHPVFAGVGGTPFDVFVSGGFVADAALLDVTGFSFDDACSTDPTTMPGTTAFLVSNAARVNYQPGTPANWPAAPTEVAAGLDRIAAALANHREDVSGVIGATAPVTFDGGAFTSTTGKVRIIAGMQVNGVTSLPGEVVLFKLLVDGAVIAAAPQLAVELSTSGVDAAIAGLTFEFAGAGLGAHTYGIQAVNSTNAAHTLQVFNLGAFVQVADTF